MIRRPLRLAVCNLAVVFLLPIQPSWAATGAPTSTVSYAGQQVVRLTALSQEDVDFLLQLNVDVWDCFGPGIGTLEARVTPDQLKALADRGIPFEILVSDLQSVVDAERENIAQARESANGSWFQSFKRGNEINDYLDTLVAQFPDVTETSVIGQSLEGRDIRMIRITGPDTAENPRDARPAFVIDGTQHAREWIAPMTVMFAVDSLVRQFNSDDRIQSVVNGVDFYFVPVVNPDGYEFTWSSDRYWRKNRRSNGGFCFGQPSFGVDLNRNWSVGWGGNNGSSPDPCSDVYRGTDPWSEPEVVVVRDFTELVYGRVGGLGAYLDFHSFGELVLSPWMYTLTAPPDAQALNFYGQFVSDAIFSVHGMRYRAGQGSHTLYIAAGVAQDWAYGELGSAAWGIELRGGDFVIPADQIIPTGEENLEGILQLCEALLLSGG
jgi:hypothetical protein